MYICCCPSLPFYPSAFLRGFLTFRDIFKLKSCKKPQSRVCQEQCCGSGSLYSKFSSSDSDPNKMYLWYKRFGSKSNFSTPSNLTK